MGPAEKGGTDAPYRRNENCVTLADRRRNEDIRNSLKTASVVDKLKEKRLGWKGHVLRREDGSLLRRVSEQQVPGGRRRRGRPKLTLARKVAADMESQSLSDDDA